MPIGIEKPKGGLNWRSMADGAVIGGKINEELYEGRYFLQKFPSIPPLLTGVDGYSAPTGATGNSNFAHFRGVVPMTAAYHIKGAGQTILGPFEDTTEGHLDAGLDQVAAEGVEYVFGGKTTLDNPLSQVVGSTPGTFVRVVAEVETVANVAELALGFRLGEAFQANLDDYNDLICLNAQYDTTACFIRVESILGGAVTVTAETGLEWADGESHEFMAWQLGRESRLFVDGVQVYRNLTQFPATTVLVPLLFWLQVTGGSYLGITELEMGRLWLVQADPSRR